MSHALGPTGPEQPWRPEPPLSPQRHASLVGRFPAAGSPADDPTGPDVPTGPFETIGEDDWYPPQPDEAEMVEPDVPDVASGGEPLVLSHALTVVLGSAVGLDWIKLDDTTINAAATAVAGVIVAAVTVVARAKVWTEASVRRELARLGESLLPLPTTARCGVAVFGLDAVTLDHERRLLWGERSPTPAASAQFDPPPRSWPLRIAAANSIKAG